MVEIVGPRADPVSVWTARLVLAGVFALNVTCAFAFITRPLEYAAGFELSGVSGEMMVRGLGILFLMWNATYPLVILRPAAHLALFGVVLAQQAIGVVGESWLWLMLPSGHATLSETGLRFIAFDAAGLVFIAAAFVLVWRSRRPMLSKGG